jgi:hypothetical protein
VQRLTETDRAVTWIKTRAPTLITLPARRIFLLPGDDLVVFRVADARKRLQFYFAALPDAANRVPALLL